MGFKISWIAAEGLAKAQLVSALGFDDTGAADEVNEAPFSSADLGNGWSLVWSNNFDWVDKELWAQLPEESNIVAVRLHEGIMYAEAFGRHDKAGQWRVFHDALEDPMHLAVQGTPPNLKDVQAGLIAQQQADTSNLVDYMFDIPVAIAARLTGFRHDQWEMPHGPRPYFTELSSPQSPGSVSA